MSRKKKGPLPPRALRMNHAGRLQSARHWLASQTGRTPVQIAKSYRKRYGVDWPCALRELSELGIHLDPRWVAQLNASLAGAQRARRKRREVLRDEATAPDPDSDEHFAYIAGCTAGGAAYGITWQEWEQLFRDNPEEGR
ncbi:MAG: hypothetical protein ABSH34_09545 [Verrucomicrobiota bacterium]|jgi:hypothetical protein